MLSYDNIVVHASCVGTTQDTIAYFLPSPVGLGMDAWAQMEHTCTHLESLEDAED